MPFLTFSYFSLHFLTFWLLIGYQRILPSDWLLGFGGKYEKAFFHFFYFSNFFQLLPLFPIFSNFYHFFQLFNNFYHFSLHFLNFPYMTLLFLTFLIFPYFSLHFHSFFFFFFSSSSSGSGCNVHCNLASDWLSGFIVSWLLIGYQDFLNFGGKIQKLIFACKLFFFIIFFRFRVQCSLQPGF